MRDDVFWGYNRRRILDRLRLDDKVAYVTGGGQGIGRAFAHALGEAGAKVAVVDLVLAKAEAVARELSLKGKDGTDRSSCCTQPSDEGCVGLLSWFSPDPLSAAQLSSIQPQWGIG